MCSGNQGPGCGSNPIPPAPNILGLQPETWDVIATVSQALAAFGALALLYITWRSGRDTKAAIENSRKLAEATDHLVIESRAQQKLAVLPVIEVSDDRHEGRIRLANKGTGPLLRPNMEVNGARLKLLGQSDANSNYVEVAALSVGGTALANVDAGALKQGRLAISGFTLAGNSFNATVELSSFDEAKRIVAQEIEEET